MQTDRQTSRQTSRQAYRQTDRQAGRQADRQAGRQTVFFLWCSQSSVDRLHFVVVFHVEWCSGAKHIFIILMYPRAFTFTYFKILRRFAKPCLLSPRIQLDLWKGEGYRTHSSPLVSNLLFPNSCPLVYRNKPLILDLCSFHTQCTMHGGPFNTVSSQHVSTAASLSVYAVYL